MSDPVLEKYHKSLQKLEMNSILKGVIKFERLLLNTKREYEPKNV